MRQLSMQDAMFVLTEQPMKNTNHIGMVFVFDPSSAPEPVTFDTVLELYRSRLPLARSFRERLVRVPLDLDYPYWINDKDFDLEFHVRHTAVPRPGTRKQFFAVVNRVMSLQLDMARAPWETYLIEGLDAVEGIPPGSFALVFKMHHAAVDGISGMEMITAILETAETAAANMPKKKWRGEDPPDQRKLFLRALGTGLSSPMQLARTLLRAAPGIAEKRKKEKSGELVKPPKVKAPKTRFNGPVSPHKVLEGRSWDFAEIRRLKGLVEDATVNDVVVAVVGGALRRYLESKRELPKESLVGTVPISLRTEEERGTGGNQLTMAFVELGTDIADPLDRVRAIGAAMRQVKNYNNAVDARSLADTTGEMPGLLIGVAIRALTRLPQGDAMRLSNTLVTNVPGPTTPMTLLGARFVAGFGAGPSMDGMGISHIITSMSGTISIGFSACREMMNDPEFYGQCIEDSFNELRAAIEAQGEAASVPRAVRPRPSAAGEKPPRRARAPK